MWLGSRHKGGAGQALSGLGGRRRFLSAAVGSVAAWAVGAGAWLAPRRAAGQQSASPTEQAKDGRPGKVRIAAIALATVDGMFENNYARAVRLVEISLRHKPDLILLPEAFAAGYCGEPLAGYAEDGQTSRHQAALGRLSARAGVMIVAGYLERVAGDRRVRNAVAIYDRGTRIGRHYKRDLWSDARRPYRDEKSLMIPGRRIEVFATRLGRFAVLTCYENYLRANWDSLVGKVDFVLSPYNCEHDPGENNIAEARRTGIASAWADRTGTVFCGDGYTANLGSAGVVGGDGTVVARSAAGVEMVAVGELGSGARGG